VSFQYLYQRVQQKFNTFHFCQVCWELGIKRINIYSVLLFVNFGVVFKTSSDSEKGRSEENGIELKKCFQGEVRKLADSECSHGSGFKCFLFCFIFRTNLLRINLLIPFMNGKLRFKEPYWKSFKFDNPVWCKKMFLISIFACVTCSALSDCLHPHGL